MSAAPAPLAKIDHWLAARRPYVLAGLLGLALFMRVLVFAELHGGPLFELHRHNEMDMHFFMQWGEHLAEKDILGRESLHPIHTWHVRMAQEEFKVDPLPVPFDDLDLAGRRSAVQKVWDVWYGGNRFHQEPLYAYLIAALRRVFGEGAPTALFVVQMLLGVWTVGLLFGLTRRVLGDLTGLGAALLAIGWGPLLHYETIVLRASLIVFFSVAVLYGVGRLRDSPAAAAGRPRPWLAYGLLLGLATATKTTLLIVGFLLVAHVSWHRRTDWRYHCRTLGPLLLGVGVVLLPFFIRNALVGAPFFSLTSVAAVTFAGSNTVHYQPAWGWSPFDCIADMAAVMRASRGSFGPTVVAAIQTHPGLLDYVGLLWQKFLLVWHWFEIPNNSSYYYTCEYSRVLAVTRYLVAAWWVIPAGLIGIVAAWRRPVGGWLLFLICSLGPLVVFYVLSRFRLPLVVGLMPFAAFAVQQCLGWILAREPRRYLPALAAFVVMAAFMNRGFTIERPVLGPGNYGFTLDAYHLPRAHERAAGKDYAGAAAEVEEFLRRMPDRVRRWGPKELPGDVFDTRLAFIYQVAYENLSNFRSQAGDVPAARRAAESAFRLQDVVKRAEAIFGKAEKRQ